MTKCLRCESELLPPFEMFCTACLHQKMLQNHQALEKHLAQMFAKKGIDYYEFKRSIEGEQI